MSTHIELRDLVFQWPGAAKPLLHILAWSVGAGQRVFLRGLSGSGKSTLLSILSGVQTPTSGECLVLGHPFHAMSATARDRIRATDIGVIFQQFNLLPYLSAWENVLLPSRLSGRAPVHEASDLLNRLGLSPALWSRPAHQLSVGQQQRVAVARAFLLGPRLLLADEPTSALDAVHQASFVSLLLELAQASKVTVIMVSHDDRMSSSFDEVWALDESGGLEAVR